MGLLPGQQLVANKEGVRREGKERHVAPRMPVRAQQRVSVPDLQAHVQVVGGGSK